MTSYTSSSESVAGREHHRKEIWRFFRKLLLFLSPLLLLIAILIISDPLKVFRNYDHYYGENNFLELNREWICLKVFEKNKESQKYNAFIFGNSRSLVFETSVWKTHLPTGAIPFHFDALGETLWGVRNKIRYLDQSGIPLKYVLWTLDEELLSVTKNRDGYQVISPPALSGASTTRFYKTFIQSMLEPEMALAYLDYSIFGQYRGYMNNIVRKSPGALSMDPITADLYYTIEEEIQKNPEAYYQPIQHIFYTRDAESISRDVESPLSQDQLDLIVEIATILDKHNAECRIIINPLYNQIPFNQSWLQVLNHYFGEENVYDFSGKNQWTESVENYYETSHFRPHVANQLMEIVYRGK